MMASQFARKLTLFLVAAGCFLFAIFWSGFTEPNPLRLAVGTRPASEALAFALTQGDFLPLSGFRLIEMAGATAISRALENGVVDAAVISLDEALQMNDSGHPVRIGMVLEESIGADVLMVLPHIRGLEMLSGIRIGAEVRSSSHYLLLKALQKGGLTLDDVELLPITGREVAAALSANQVDALVVTEPDAQRIPAGEMERLYDSSELPNPILRVLAVREEVWDEKKHVLRRIAERYLQVQPRIQAGEEAFLQFLEFRARLDRGAVSNILSRVRFPDRAQMRSWLTSERIGEVLKSKMKDMQEAGFLAGEGLVLPFWDDSLLKP